MPLTGLKAWKHAAALAPGDDCRATVSGKTANSAGGVGLAVSESRDHVSGEFQGHGNANFDRDGQRHRTEKGRFDFADGRIGKETKDFTG